VVVPVPIPRVVFGMLPACRVVLTTRPVMLRILIREVFIRVFLRIIIRIDCSSKIILWIFSAMRNGGPLTVYKTVT
jgi:hypothetical protein